MDVAIATAVLSAAKEVGIFREDMPTEDDVRIDKASRLVRQAEAAERAGASQAAVQAVLGAARSNAAQAPESNGHAEASTAGEVASEPGSGESPANGSEPGALAAPAVEDPLPQLRPAPMDAMQSARGGFNPNSSRPGNAWECADCDYACGSETGLKRHLNKASHSMTPVTERTGVQTTIEDAIAMGQEATDNATGPIAVIEGTPPQVHDPTWSPDTQRVVTPETRPQPGTSSLHDAIEYVHTERAVARIDSMRLPKPDEFEADPPKRPVDMSKCSTEELRSLYSSFNACSAYARYHLALEEAKADDCKRILARKESQIVTSLNALDIHGKPKTVTTLKNEAFNSSEELRQWAERQAEHIATAKLLRAMLESYDLDCTRISRDLAQRQAELAHS